MLSSSLPNPSFSDCTSYSSHFHMHKVSSKRSASHCSSGIDPTMREFPPTQDSALPSQPSTCLLAKRKCSLDSQECPIPLPVIRHIKKSRSVNAHGEDRLTKRAQKLRSSRTHDRQNTLAPSPEPIYRSSRSRSTSSFPSGCSDVPVQRRRWCVDDDGTPGPTHISSELVVKKLMRTYKGYFKNPNDPKDRSFQPHPHCYPYVELEYPNSGAVERFILLAPKDKDHYNPILDLEQTLYAIVECYLTREQQSLFGSIPADSFSDSPPRPSSPPSTTSISSTDDLTTSETRQSSLEADLLPLASLSGSSRSSKPASMALLRAVKRAINRQDGPLFLAAMSQINALLHALKYPKLPDDLFAPVPSNALQSAVDGWEHTGLPKKVLMRIIEENYQRIVGPNVVSLKQYEAFSSTVYGELMPSLVHEIVQITGLREESLFLDLGSGVGNVVVQASLQTGCRSFGIELMPAPARIAREMVKQMRIRCRMWGVRMGEVELEEGNMLSSKRMDELIPQADVVLVDNKVFEESLNEALRPKFLDLKEGAIVVSLAPFVSSLNARVTERNVDDISAIFDVTERAYHSGSVSWGINGGSYYIHRVDRAGYAQIRERFESSRARSTRTRK